MINHIIKCLEQCSPIQKHYILAIISGLTLANNIVRESRKEENPTYKFYLAAELNKFISDNQSEPTQGAACTSSGEG